MTIDYDKSKARMQLIASLIGVGVLGYLAIIDGGTFDFEFGWFFRIFAFVAFALMCLRAVIFFKIVTRDTPLIEVADGHMTMWMALQKNPMYRVPLEEITEIFVDDLRRKRLRVKVRDVNVIAADWLKKTQESNPGHIEKLQETGLMVPIQLPDCDLPEIADKLREATGKPVTLTEPTV